MLTRLDKNLFAIYCYASNKFSDKATDYLRGMIKRSPLMDSAGYIRDVEKVFANLVTNRPPVV